MGPWGRDVSSPSNLLFEEIISFSAVEEGVVEGVPGRMGEGGPGERTS